MFCARHVATFPISPCLYRITQRSSRNILANCGSLNPLSCGGEPPLIRGFLVRAGLITVMPLEDCGTVLVAIFTKLSKTKTCLWRFSRNFQKKPACGDFHETSQKNLLVAIFTKLPKTKTCLWRFSRNFQKKTPHSTEFQPRGLHV